MVYLDDIKENSCELKYQYDFRTLKKYIYGHPFVQFFDNFCKYPSSVADDVKSILDVEKIYNNYIDYPTGMVFRFRVEEDCRLVFRVKLRRRFSYSNMTLFGSSGFDVYIDKGDGYEHKTVFAPVEGKYLFLHKIHFKEAANILIFLPNYNAIDEIYVESSKEILENKSFSEGKPIIFYGNSITQGASASCSGNSFVNIVGRQLNVETINYSLSSCCIGSLETAQIIGRLNASAIVIDYTRNAPNLLHLKESYKKFYGVVRHRHPKIPIIIMTSAGFGITNRENDYDKFIWKFYESTRLIDSNLYILDQKKCFDNINPVFVSVDGVHYNDLGMTIIANKIIEVMDKAFQYSK